MSESQIDRSPLNGIAVAGFVLSLVGLVAGILWLPVGALLFGGFAVLMAGAALIGLRARRGMALAGLLVGVAAVTYGILELAI